MVLARTIFCLAILSTIGCITQSQPIRVSNQQPVQVVVIVDQHNGSDLATVPESFHKSLKTHLDAANLASFIFAYGPDSRTGGIEFGPTTSSRLRTLATLSNGTATKSDAPFLLLVEVRAELYSQLQGRFRWTVYYKVTLANRDHLQQASTTSFSIPAMLDHAHETGDDAIASVADLAARKISQDTATYISDKLEEPANGKVSARSNFGDAIYFVLVDRFHNGDPSNDQTVDAGDPQAFHGGDLAGLIDKLDYIKNLGFDTVWLSPVFEMRTEKIGEHGAFHGYWTNDLRTVESRFGTEADLLILRSELDKRHMKLILDMVLNHVGYDAPLTREKPQWFNAHGPIEDWDNPQQLTDYQVHGLPDLNQRDPEVVDYLLSATSHWIKTLHPEGLRLDAVKHVPVEFWKQYTKAVSKDSKTLGELYDGNAEALVAGLNAAGFDALFDFPLYFAVNDVYCRAAHPAVLGTVLAWDRSFGHGNRLVTFADNHDLPRIMTSCGNDANKVRDALTFLLTARGTPAVTYGTEVGLTGAGEPENRGDMSFRHNPLARHIHKLLALRRNVDALRDGIAVPFLVSDRAFAYAKVGRDSVAIVAINHGDTPLTLSPPEDLQLSPHVTDALAKAQIPATKMTVAPGRTAVFTSNGVDARANRAVRARLLRRRDKRLTFVVPNRPANAAPIYVRGSGPTLSWSGAPGALARFQPSTNDWRVTVSVQPGSVLAYKLQAAQERAGGDTGYSWERGENRFVLVDRDHANETIRAPWRE